MPQLDTAFLTPLLFWTTVSFAMLLFLLNKYAFPVFFQILKEREQKIRGGIEEAERLRAEAQGLLGQYEGRLRGAQQEVQAILEEARQQSREILDQGQRKMERENQRMIEEAKNRIQREQQQAMREIQQATVELTLTATEKILERKLTEADNNRFVKEVIQEISQGENG